MDWKNVLGKAAPMLGAALGGPLGGAAAGVVAEALGLGDASAESIKAALRGTTPEQMLALKNAEREFVVKMRELDIASVKEVEALAVSDRDSARKREVEVKDKTPRNLAYAITAGFFGTLLTTMFIKIDPATQGVVNVLLGTLGGGFTGIIAYYFGSTAGSRAKTELLAKAQPVPDEEPVTPPNPFAK